MWSPRIHTVERFAITGRSDLDIRQGRSDLDICQGHSDLDIRQGRSDLDIHQGRSDLDIRQGRSDFDIRRRPTHRRPGWSPIVHLAFAVLFPCPLSFALRGVLRLRSATPGVLLLGVRCLAHRADLTSGWG